MTEEVKNHKSNNPHIELNLVGKQLFIKGEKQFIQFITNLF